MKNRFFVYIQGGRCVYMIWGHYIIGNGTSNLVLTFSNVLEPYEHPNTKISKNIFFAYKKWPKMAIFGKFLYVKNIFFEILVLGCSYGSNTFEKVKTSLEVPFPMI